MGMIFTLNFSVFIDKGKFLFAFINHKILNQVINEVKFDEWNNGFTKINYQF